MTLGEYLLAAEKRPWIDGEHDCSAWPAHWAGIPLPSYSTAEEAQSLIDGAGDLVALWARCIGDRLRRVQEPAAGDVGIIQAVGTDRRVVQVGAIFTGRRWAFLIPQGLVRASAEALAVWRVPCPRL